jgi:hypothetical protein
MKEYIEKNSIVYYDDYIQIQEYEVSRLFTSPM